MLKAVIISDLRVASCVPNIGNLFSGLYKRKSIVRRIRHHQMLGRSWLAGESCGDGEPEGRDRPLEKGVGGIDSGARSVRVWDRVPMKNKTEGGKSSLGQPCCRALTFCATCK